MVHAASPPCFVWHDAQKRFEAALPTAVPPRFIGPCPSLGGLRQQELREAVRAMRDLVLAGRRVHAKEKFRLPPEVYV